MHKPEFRIGINSGESVVKKIHGPNVVCGLSIWKTVRPNNIMPGIRKFTNLETDSPLAKSQN